MKEYSEIADKVIAHAYPSDKGSGWWGEQRIPNYGILRGAIEAAIKEAVEKAVFGSQEIIRFQEKRITELEAELTNACLATHRQAYCINLCAAYIGPDTSATIDGLPLAVKRLTSTVKRLEEEIINALSCLGDKAPVEERIITVAREVLQAALAGGKEESHE
jgi:hypothetical protein